LGRRLCGGGKLLRGTGPAESLLVGKAFGAKLSMALFTAPDDSLAAAEVALVLRQIFTAGTGGLERLENITAFFAGHSALLRLISLSAKYIPASRIFPPGRENQFYRCR